MLPREKREREKSLIEKYPVLFQDTVKSPQESCMYWGISVDDGWFKLIEAVCEQLKGYPIKFEQIKEKFGALRIYWSTLDGETLTDAKRDTINKILGCASEESIHTCEKCGSMHNVTARKTGWIKYWCADCHKKFEEKNKKCDTSETKIEKLCNADCDGEAKVYKNIQDAKETMDKL